MINRPFSGLRSRTNGTGKQMKTDLTTGRVRGHLIRMTIPMVWGLLAVIMMNVVDTFFVAQLGTVQLAAISFIFPVVMIRNALAFGIGVGVSSVVSRAYGGRNTEKVKSYTTQALILAFAISATFAAAGYMTIDPLFRMLGADDDVLVHIRLYMEIWYLGCFLVVIPMVGNAAIRAMGNTKFPSYIMILIAVLNMILDPILIFGLLGFPRLEMQGAALATVFSYSVAFFVSLYVLAFKMRIIDLRSCVTRVAESWKAILHVGIPALGSNLMSPLYMGMTTWLVARYGSEAVAGYGVATRIEAICLIVLYALSSVMVPIVGQNWGAGRTDRVRHAVYHAARFSLFWGVCMAAVLWVFAMPLIRLFDDDPVAVQSAFWYLMIVPVTYTLQGVLMVSANMMNGIGAPRASLMTTFARVIPVYLPPALLFSHLWGLKGLYIATALANILVGIGAYLWCVNKTKAAAEERNAGRKLRNNKKQKPAALNK